MHTLPAKRLDWVDNLRVALIVLVVAHHAAQAYGPDDWWYVQDQPGAGPLATFSAVNGTFFMSLFFFVSAFLAPAALDRHGPRAFLTGRLRRLVIPLLVGAVTIVPGLMYAYYTRYRGYPPIDLPTYVIDVYLGFGERPAGRTGPSWPDLQFAHLWFIQNLFVYSLLYLVCHQLAQRLRRGARGPARRVPGHLALVGLTGAVAAGTFLIRLWYPLDEWVAVLDFLQVEPARLVQYATFFALGVLAARHDWLTRLPARVGWVWLGAGTALTAGLFAAGTDTPVFAGGGANVESLLWSLYESVSCTGLSVGLLVLFREFCRRGTRFTRSLAASSFTVYIVHVPVVVAVQFALAGSGLGALASFAVTAVAGVAVSFAAAELLRRLPGFRAVL